MKVLFSIHAHIGDNICAEPAVREWKYQNPDKQLFVETKYRELWSNNPYISGIYNWCEYHNCWKECDDVRQWRNKSWRLEDTCAAALGVKLKDIIPRFYFPANFVNKYILDKPYIVISISPTTSARRWHSNNWQTLINFVRLAGFKIVQIGAKWASRINTDIDLLGQTTLTEAADIIKKADYFLGVDSGMAHMAAAVNTPALVLYGNVPSARRQFIDRCISLDCRNKDINTITIDDAIAGFKRLIKRFGNKEFEVKERVKIKGRRLAYA